MDHQQDAVWSSALWTQHRSRARFPWLHFRTGIKAISNWCLVSFCSIAAFLAKTLGTVMQYSWFSVISGCPYKTVQPFKKILQFSRATPYTKLKLKTILDTHVHPCLWGGGEVGHCDLKRASPMPMECPRLLSMIESTNATIWKQLAWLRSCRISRCENEWLNEWKFI